MNIVRTPHDNNISLSLDGRLDTTTAPQLQEALLPLFDSTEEVVLDFSKLAYVSSAGLRVLLMGEKTAKSKGAKQVLTNVSSEIMEVFEMTGFSGVLNFA